MYFLYLDDKLYAPADTGNGWVSCNLVDGITVKTEHKKISGYKKGVLLTAFEVCAKFDTKNKDTIFWGEQVSQPKEEDK